MSCALLDAPPFGHTMFWSDLSPSTPYGSTEHHATSGHGCLHWDCRGIDAEIAIKIDNPTEESNRVRLWTFTTANWLRGPTA